MRPVVVRRASMGERDGWPAWCESSNQIIPVSPPTNFKGARRWWSSGSALMATTHEPG